MKKSLLPTSVQARDYANLNFKLWQFSLLFFFFSLGSFSVSAQEISHNESAPAGIVVVGGAVIYSKDESFNQQISKSKSIQQYSKVVKLNDDEIKLIAKNSTTESPAKQSSEELHPKKKLLVSKEEKMAKSLADLPKKEITLKISNGLDGSRFLTGKRSGDISFISPNNDYQYFKCIVLSNEQSKTVSLDFLYSADYFYTHSNYNLKANPVGYSVRPPPDLI